MSHIGYHFTGWQIILNNTPAIEIKDYGNLENHEIKTARMRALISTLLETGFANTGYDYTSVIDIAIVAQYSESDTVFTMDTGYVLDDEDEGPILPAGTTIQMGKMLHVHVEPTYVKDDITYNFVHWVYTDNDSGNDKIMESTDLIIKPTRANSEGVIRLRACYESDGEAYVAEARADIVDAFAEIVNGVHKLGFSFTYVVPGGADSTEYEIVEYGCYYVMDPNKEYGFYKAGKNSKTTSGYQAFNYILHMSVKDQIKWEVPFEVTPFVKYQLIGNTDADQIVEFKGKPVTKSWNDLAEEGVRIS